MADEDVKIKLALEGDDKVRSGLKGVGDDAESSDGKLKGLASAGLKGVAVGAAALGAAVVGAGAGLVGIASGAAAAGDRIDEMSQKLGLSNQAYQEWDYILSQNGISVDTLQGGLNRLNNAVDDAANGAGTAGASFDRLGISAADLAGKSREDIFAMTIQGLQGVTDQGERAAIANDLLGKSASELGPLLNAGATNTEELKQKAHELGLVMSDEAVAAADNFGDSLDSLKRQAEGLRNKLGAELLPGITQVIDGLSGLLAGQAGAEEQIQQGAQALVTGISSVLPQILTVVGTLVGSIAAAAPTLLTGLVQGVVSAIPGLISAVVPLLSGLVNAVVALAPQLLSAGVQAVLSLVAGISQVIPTLLPLLVGAILNLATAVINAAPMLLQAGIVLLGGLTTGILAALPLIVEALPGLIDGIVNFIVTGVPALLQAGIELLLGLVGAIPEVVVALVSALPQIIVALITTLLAAIPLLINAGIDLLTSLVGALPTIIVAIVAAIPQIISGLLTALLGSLPLIVEAGLNLFISLIQALPQIIITVVAAIPQIITGVINALVAAIPLLITTGVKLLVALVQNLPAIIGGVIAAVPQIIGGLINAFMGMKDQLSDTGYNLIRGLWEGISDAAGWLMGKIGGFVDQVMGGIKDFFGIHSPSKRMQDEIGAWLPSGIGVGIEVHRNDAIEPLKDLNQSIMAEAQKLNTSVAFTTDATLTQTLVPMRATPTAQGPVNVEATIDPYVISSAIADSLSASGAQEQAPVTLSRESIDRLASAIVSGVRVQSRQGALALG
jgi:phage-related protein